MPTTTVGIDRSTPLGATLTGFRNPTAVGNDCQVTAKDLARDGMPASAAIALLANGLIVFIR